MSRYYNRVQGFVNLLEVHGRELPEDARQKVEIAYARAIVEAEVQAPGEYKLLLEDKRVRDFMESRHRLIELARQQSQKSNVVFFGCSMRGGYIEVSQDELRVLQLLVKELGYQLASEHQTRAGIIQEENQRRKTEIHDRDFGLLINSTAAIFEISNPSLGVGAEISDAISMGLPVLCLYKRGLQDRVSAYILGKAGSDFVSSSFECREYDSIEEAREIMRKFLESHAQS